MDKVTKARAQFLTWLKSTNPDVFERVVSVAESGMGDLPPVDFGLRGMGAAEATESETWWQKLSSGLTAMGSAYLGYQTQKDLIELNMQRAEQGLAPLENTIAPTVRTEVALDPAIVQRLQESATAGLSNMLLIGGVVLGAFFLMKGKRRR